MRRSSAPICWRRGGRGRRKAWGFSLRWRRWLSTGVAGDEGWAFVAEAGGFGGVAGAAEGAEVVEIAGASEGYGDDVIDFGAFGGAAELADLFVAAEDGGAALVPVAGAGDGVDTGELFANGAELFGFYGGEAPGADAGSVAAEGVEFLLEFIPGDDAEGGMGDSVDAWFGQGEASSCHYPACE